MRCAPICRHCPGPVPYFLPTEVNTRKRPRITQRKARSIVMRVERASDLGESGGIPSSTRASIIKNGPLFCHKVNELALASGWVFLSALPCKFAVDHSSVKAIVTPGSVSSLALLKVGAPAPYATSSANRAKRSKRPFYRTRRFCRGPVIQMSEIAVERTSGK